MFSKYRIYCVTLYQSRISQGFIIDKSDNQILSKPHFSNNNEHMSIETQTLGAFFVNAYLLGSLSQRGLCMRTEPCIFQWFIVN